ncbi:MAG: ATP-binding protein [Sideroxyarcus sp.]|nr:ATP-binding protein [Sideroxyarcus sp.]
MNIFVAGVHGVGKTHLASRLPEAFGMTHTSASKLIREERAMPNWGADKKVNDIDGNQAALATAVKRHNTAGTRLLLDGHFVLLNDQREFSRLEPTVFASLNLNGVILLEDAPQTIAQRIQERDDRKEDIKHIAEFIAVERQQAETVCHILGIPLHVLNCPRTDTFCEAIMAITSPK